MGNCVFKGFRAVEVEEMVKVVTSNGGIMELYAPVTAESITNQFPGHAIFRGSELLSHNYQLLPGQFYHLLPINTQEKLSSDVMETGHRLDNNNNMTATPYRMSFGKQRMLKRPEVFPRYSNRGVWKVKLVISPEQLSQILSQDARTEELIESVRAVAKCSNGLPHSDQQSVNSSLKASSGKYGCHVD